MFVSWGILPNVLTLIGLLGCILVGLCIAKGYLVLAGVLLTISGLLDIIDGEVARMQNNVTKWGAYLDSVTDRYADGAIFMGLAHFFTVRGEMVYVGISILTFIGAFLVSYTKARAENVIGPFKVGIMERSERLILLVLGLVTLQIRPLLWLLMVLIHITALQRLFYVFEKLKE